MQRGQSTLEWVIGAAVILGTIATQRHLCLEPAFASSAEGTLAADPG